MAQHCIKLILILLLCSTAMGADVVETSIDMLNTGGSKQQTVQGIPREHIAPGDDSTDVLIIHQFYVSTFFDHIFIWDATDPNGFADSSFLDANVGSHLHIARRNDTLWIACNPSSADSALIYIIDIPTLTVTDTGSFDMTGTNAVVAGIEHYGGGDDMLMVYRDGLMTDSNLYYAISDDNGLTWTAQDDIIEYNQDCRFDLDPVGDSIYLVSYLRGGSPRRYDYLLWDGSTWSSVGDTAITTQGSAIYERLFSTTIGFENMRHLAFSDTAVPSHVIHAYWHPDSADWVVGNAFTANTKVENPEAMWTAMTHSKFGEITRLYYTAPDADNQYHKLYCMQWDNDDYTWGSPVQIGTDSTITNLAGCLNVPAEHGDRSYILYTTYIIADNDYINRFAVIRDSTTVALSDAPDSLVAAKIDYWDTDYSGELDEFWVAAQIDSVGACDSIAFAISDTGYVDSSVSLTWITPSILTSWNITQIANLSAEDGDSIYLSAWPYIAGGGRDQAGYGARTTSSMFFDEDINVLITCQTSITAADQTWVIGGTKLECPMATGSGSEQAINVSSSADNMTLFLGTDTLIWGMDSTYSISQLQGTVSGIFLDADSSRISGGYILHAPDNVMDWVWKDDVQYRYDEIDTTFTAYDSIHLWDWETDAYNGGATNLADSVTTNRIGVIIHADGVTLDSIQEINIYGYADLGVFGGRSVRTEGAGITIRKSRIYNYIYGYKNRGAFDAAGVEIAGIWADYSTSSYDYGVRIENSYISSFSWSTIFVNASSQGSWTGMHVELYNDSVLLDGRSLRWEEEGGAENGTANKYGFFYVGSAGSDSIGGYIRKCTFVAGTAWNGGRCIGNTNGAARSDDPFVIDSCVGFANEGDAQDIGEIYYPDAVKFRGARNWTLKNSQFTYYCDGSYPNGWNGHQSAYYNRGWAFVAQQAAYGIPTKLDYGITVENNLFRAIDVSGGAVLLAAVAFDNYRYYDSTFLWRNNRVESDSVGYLFGYFDNYVSQVGGDSIHITGDTLILVDTSMGHTTYKMPNGLGYEALGVVMRDMTYGIDSGSGVSYTDSAVALDTNIVFGDDADITLEETIQFLVIDSNDVPIQNCTVKVVNNFSYEVLNDVTDANGEISCVAKYWWEYDGGSGSNDSVFNPLAIEVYKNGDTALDSTWTIDCNRATVDTVVFAAAAETPATGIKLIGGHPIGGYIR